MQFLALQTSLSDLSLLLFPSGTVIHHVGVVQNPTCKVAMLYVFRSAFRGLPRRASKNLLILARSWDLGTLLIARLVISQLQVRLHGLAKGRV